MSSPPVRGMPPRLLTFEILTSEQLPDFVRIEIHAEDGRHSFLVGVNSLKAIGNKCLADSTKVTSRGTLN